MTLVVVEEKQKILLNFGQRVRKLRTAKGLSQEAFAALCGLDRTYISGIERGVRNVSLANIRLVANALDISLSELMQGL
jgi:transcriptional regulator with XRE-family HTH domain